MENLGWSDFWFKGWNKSIIHLYSAVHKYLDSCTISVLLFSTPVEIKPQIMGFKCSL